MKAGVRTTPDDVWSRPARAAPSRAVISKRRRSGSARTGPEAYASNALLLGSGPVNGSSADPNAVRLTLLGLRDAYLQHPLVEARVDALRVNVLRQSHRPGEAAERPLDAVVPVGLLLVLGLALTGNGEHAVLDLDVHVAGVEAGKIRPEHEMIIGLDDGPSAPPSDEARRLRDARRRTCRRAGSSPTGASRPRESDPNVRLPFSFLLLIRGENLSLYLADVLSLS